MQKKGGSFFKKILTGGQSLFKKSDKKSANEPTHNEEQNSDEDNDLYEVGKQGQKQPSQSILQNFQDFAGSTIQAADQFLHGSSNSNSKNGGGSSSVHSRLSKGDLSQICRVLNTDDTQEAEQRNNKKNKKNSQSDKQAENQNNNEEDDQDVDYDYQNQKVLPENIYFAELQKINFELLLRKNNEEVKQSENTTKIDQHQLHNMKTIEFILLVGFHHKVGSQIEFIYPPLKEDVEGNLSVEFLKHIPLVALPDGSHLTEAGYANFILKDAKNLYHCVSCFRQIPASLLPQQDSISRAFVQKAVVIMSKIPIYGQLRAKLQPTTQALFAQLNFNDTTILSDFYKHANSFNTGMVKDYSEFLTGLNLKQMVNICGMNLSSKVSNFLYSLIALFPGNASFQYLNSEQVLLYQRSLKAYGMPFQLYNESCPFVPLMTLYEIDNFEKWSGYLVGSTNQLFLNFPKSKADIVINLDLEKIEFPQEKTNKNSIIKISQSHTSYEKKLMQQWLKSLSLIQEDNGGKQQQQKISKANIMMKQDQSETSIFLNANEDEQNYIIQEIKKYFQTFCIQLALSKKYNDDYNNVRYSPVKQKQPDRTPGGKKSSSEDSDDENGENDESVIILGRIPQDESEIVQSQNLNIKAANQQDDPVFISVGDSHFTQNQEESKKRSKSKNKYEVKIQKINEKFQQLQVSETKYSNNESKLKKINTLRKKAVKSILEYNGMFSLKFYLAWTQTEAFQFWIKNFDSNICALSCQSGSVHNTFIHYENGDYYCGQMYNGVRKGMGQYYEYLTELTYNGYWLEDMRHGQGNLSSKNNEYSYDGEFYKGMKQGRGILVTKNEKYSGNFYKDKFHKNGVLFETDGSEYDGDWVLGKKEGMCQYKRGNGDFYIGEMFNNYYHGKGQLRCAKDENGHSELYNGDFQEGKRHGHGQYISSDQLIQYDGEWEEDKREGRGTLIITSEETGITKYIENLWSNDEFQFNQICKVTIKDRHGKQISSFEGKVDANYNPILT
ncbi:UNKNOWN [Stylonychia lemnae]|uniref:UDENN domain-containing protein n=1 Tax=Stylonychia lemnae TaxID=5949 RepID=A0A077ZZ59_STYLE|nr:UNKNOWN [Stylonychia lemnae]|eukprot:CDW75236.1 UNKNOWN [Stylonychia lemnae]